MKYPLDSTTFAEYMTAVEIHNKSQCALIQKMCELLEEAMDDSESDDSDWYAQSEVLLKSLHSLKMYHESRRWNDDNLRKQKGFEPSNMTSGVLDIEEVDEDSQGEMSEAELARHFKEKRSTKKSKEPEKDFKKMTLEEIESWEKAQDNSNDIYKIKARVANLARGPGMSLTPQGDILCNSFVHVLKALYDFSETIPDKDTKIKLVQIIRGQEGMPGTIIAAAGAGVKKDEKDKETV